MFELADRLIGIFKTDNCTKSVAINPQLIASEAWYCYCMMVCSYSCINSGQMGWSKLESDWS